MSRIDIPIPPLETLIECRDGGAWRALQAAAQGDLENYVAEIIGREIGPETIGLQARVRLLRSFFGLDGKDSALDRLITDAKAREKDNDR